MEPELVRIPHVPRPTSVVVFVLVFIGVVLLIGAGPIRTVPAGNVGVKDFFGQVSASTLSPGVNIVVPLTSVAKMSIQTGNQRSRGGAVPGLILSPETSPLFQLDPPSHLPHRGR